MFPKGALYSDAGSFLSFDVWRNEFFLTLCILRISENHPGLHFFCFRLLYQI